jgi:type II secretory pathway pseudopilin PulG
VRKFDGFSNAQNGLALVIFVVVLVLAVLALIANGLSTRTAKLERNKITTAALARAKEALIAYAVRYSETHPSNVPGYLPCPDTGSPEGSGATCGNKNVSLLRRLPWRELGIEALRDSSGECLWYAVAGTFKNLPQTDLMNWDNNGLIEVVADDGATLMAGAMPGNRAAAVVIAPGPAIGAQNRAKAATANECGGNYVVSNYLETSKGVNNALVSTIANALSRLIAGVESETFNDKIIFITPDEIFEPIRKRKDFQTRLEALTSTIGGCLGRYGEFNGSPAVITDHRLPWPALVNLANFNTNPSYDDTAAGARKSGRLPFVVNTSKVATSNQMVGVNLLTNVAFDICPLWSTDDDAWYKNWKDHFFYYVGGSFTPIAPHPTILPCASCLSVNGAGSFAAVVLFAGEKTRGQSRNSVAEKGLIGNYLEGRNSTSHPNVGGASNLEISGTSNDFLLCIDFNPITNASRTFPCPGP